MLSLKYIIAALIIFILFSFIFIFGAASLKAQDTAIEMRDFQEGDLMVDGFELKSPQEVTIHAVGARLKNSDEMFAYPWIIDGTTGEPVWIFGEQKTNRLSGSESLREYEDQINLPAGKYECFFYAGRPYFMGDLNIEIDNLGEALSWLGDYLDNKEDKNLRYYKEDLQDLLFTVKAPAGSFIKYNPVAEIRKDAIVDFSQAGDDYSAKKGFSLKSGIPLKIISIGEYSSSDRVFVDYGWIIDARTRKKVWQMDKWNTTWAGGGRKNRGLDDSLSLPAGDYVAYFVTDDSHSFDDWNTQPPFDPLHYGLTVYPLKSSDIQYVSSFQDNYTEPVIVEMTRVRDNAFKSKGFTLKKETSLHIIALGEYGYSDEFVDYGWIENLDDNERVWEMTEDNTEHAGGASKNRKFDGVITLPAGNYMVYYVSDNSHSYRHWNASAPVDQEMWGITIYGVGKDFDPKSVAVFDEAPEPGGLLVNLTKIGDDADVEQEFKINSQQKVRIHALGEGRDGEMFDYGWIENAKTGETIWEMTYRMTRPAGGSEKNRKVDAQILLEPGDYIAHYVTDGSHSFPNFNTARPDNPQKWGITISKE